MVFMADREVRRARRQNIHFAIFDACSSGTDVSEPLTSGHLDPIVSPRGKGSPKTAFGLMTPAAWYTQRESLANSAAALIQGLRSGGPYA
jgi:hypothetical protein